MPRGGGGEWSWRANFVQRLDVNEVDAHSPLERLTVDVKVSTYWTQGLNPPVNKVQSLPTFM